MPRIHNADRLCTTPNCGRPVRCRDLCKVCYSRAIAARSIAPLPPQPSEERFWSKVNKDGPTMAHMTTPCWVWTAYADRKGYGRLQYGGNPSAIATRVSWRLAHGTGAGGLMVCHRCDNPPCVNPDHLFLGTARDNIHDMHAKGRQADVALTRHIGEDSGAAKLTDNQVREIRAAYSAGAATQVALAARYGVTQGSVSKICRRATWTHIE